MSIILVRCIMCGHEFEHKSNKPAKDILCVDNECLKCGHGGTTLVRQLE